MTIFLSAQYGEEKAFEYLRNWNSNIIPWRMQSRAYQVFGLNAEALWQQYQAYLENKFEQQMARLPVVDYEPVVEGGRVNANPVWMADGRFYYYREDGRHHPSLQVIDADGNDSKVTDVLEYQHIDVHPQAGVLLSRHTVCNNYAARHMYACSGLASIPCTMPSFRIMPVVVAQSS